MAFHGLGISIGKFLSSSLGDSLILAFKRNRRNWDENVT